MTTLHLVRHGETDWNREGRYQGTRDVPLNEAGREQARRLASSWTWGGDALVASPLSRAWETAALLSPVLGLTGRPDARLVERGFGHAEGLTLAQRTLAFPDGDVPGIESLDAVQARAVSFLESVAREHAGQTLVAVSHGGLINTVLAVVSRGDVGTGKTVLANCSVTTLRFDDSGWVVARLA